MHILPEEDVLPYWYGFARIRGSTFLKLAFIEDSIESRYIRSKYVLMTVVVLFFLGEFFISFTHKVFNEATKCKCNLCHHVLFLHIFTTGFLRVLMRHMLVAVFVQGGVLRNPNERLCGQYWICPREVSRLYILNMYPLIWNTKEKEAIGPNLHHMSHVLSIVEASRSFRTEMWYKY